MKPPSNRERGKGREWLSIAVLVPLLVLLTTSLHAQPNFDIGDSEIAVWNTSTLNNISVEVKAVGLIFDDQLAVTHKHAEIASPRIDHGVAWGYEGPWSYDAAAGDITVVQDTIGCGEYEFEINGIPFRLNLIDAKWGAGSTNSVYRILIEFDGNVKLHVRTPGTTGTWSGPILVANGDRFTYWELIQSTHSAGYLRERTTYNGKRFHVAGDDDQLPLLSTNVQFAKLDVNIDIHVPVTVPAMTTLLIEGYDEGATGNSDTRLRFDPQTGLTVYGELRTVDTQYRNEYVIFSPVSATPNPGEWTGISCPIPNGLTLNRVWIHHAELGLDIDWVYPLSGNNVMVTSCLTDGVRIARSTGEFHDLKSYNNLENNLDVRSSEMAFHDSRFHGSVNQNGVVCGDGATVLFRRCSIHSNRMNGVYGYAFAYIHIDSCDVYDNGVLPGEDWVGVYTFFNDWPLFLRNSRIYGQSVGVGAVWSAVYGYYTSSFPPARWDNPDSLGRNCVFLNDLNLYGHHSTYEFGMAKYERNTPHYQGGENSIFDPNILQGSFEYSEAWLERDWWKGNTLFNVLNSLVSTADALPVDIAGCSPEFVTGYTAGTTSSHSSGSLNEATCRAWDGISVDSLRLMLNASRSTLSAEEAYAGFQRVWMRSDSATARRFFEAVIAGSTRDEVLFPAYRHLAASHMHAGQWSSAVQALQAMTGHTRYGGTGYTSAQAMRGLAMHLGGGTASAQSHLDSLLRSFPGDRDLVTVHRLIGGASPSPKHSARSRHTGAADGYELHAAHPNPFASTTTVSFTLPVAGRATVTVFDLSGREVARLADGWYPAGTTPLRFDAGGLPAGIYIVRLSASGVNRTRTLNLLR